MTTHYLQSIVLNAENNLCCVHEEQSYADCSRVHQKESQLHITIIIQLNTVYVQFVFSQLECKLLREELLFSTFENLLLQMPSMVLYIHQSMLVKGNGGSIESQLKTSLFCTGALRSVTTCTSKILCVSTCWKCQPSHGLEC